MSLVANLVSNQRLGHLVGLNDLFLQLGPLGADPAGCRLEQWWSERRCAREWGEVVRPDRYGVWSEGGAGVAFLPSTTFKLSPSEDPRVVGPPARVFERPAPGRHR